MPSIVTAAFAAGMVSTVNPCGFAMLPAYLGFFLGSPADRVRRLGRVVLAMGAGFVAVFTVAGVVLAAGFRVLVSLVPWMALVVGVGLVAVGAAQLAGRRLLPYLRGPGRARKDGSFLGIVVFGASYAVASLSCTLPIFLSIVGGSVASGSVLETVGVFVAYGAGMSLVVAVVTALVAAGRTGLVDRFRPLAGRLDVITGTVMVVSGLFVVWYWATILTSGPVGAGSNGVVRWIDERSAEVTAFLGGNLGMWLVASGATAILILALRRTVRARRAVAPGERREPVS